MRFWPSSISFQKALVAPNLSSSSATVRLDWSERENPAVYSCGALAAPAHFLVLLEINPIVFGAIYQNNLRCSLDTTPQNGHSHP